MIKTLSTALGALLLGTTAQAACGPDPEACALGDGEYHIALPKSDQEQPPVVMFLHGAGGHGGTVMRNVGLVNSLLDRGYAVIAPSGSRRFAEGGGRLWNFFPDWDGRDETVFLQDVVADAATRFDVNPDVVLLSGFSAGGFMVNYLACEAPETFSAYASVSGGFWRPDPNVCAGPVKLFHTHGWADKTVPLEGRTLRNGEFEQGDIFAGLEIWRTANQCADHAPDGYSETGEFWRRIWTDCAENSALELAVFPGGHRLPTGWSDMALDWFEDVTAP